MGSPASGTRLGLTLAAACVAQFMILLDTTIVNVALPSIQHDLDASTGNLEWIVNSYVLTLASLILLAGGLGDRFGRKRYFVLGFVIFTAFSAACALSTSEYQLIAFRALQGVGAALLAPLALSILVDAFPPERRAFAIGMWAGIAGLGFGAGPIIGGLLLAAFDWTAVFWVNVPFGVLGILLTLFFVRESRDPNARRLDVGGAVLVSAGLVCLTVALVETDDHAWFSVFTLSFLALAAVLLAAFVAYEARHAHPMVPLEFFRRRVFASANAVYALMYASLGAMLFFTTLYLQNVQGHSALVTGLAFLFLNIPFLLIAPFAARIQRRFGSGRVIVVGTLVTGLGLSGLAFLDVDSSFAAIVPPFVLVGIGFGLAAPALPSVGMAAIGPEHGGVASGVINTSRQMGAAIGLASVGSISLQVVTRAWGDYVDALPSPAQSEASSLTGAVVGGEGHEVGVSLGASAAAEAFDAFVSGFRAAMLAAGALTLLGCLVVVIGFRPGFRSAPSVPQLDPGLVPSTADESEAT